MRVNQSDLRGTIVLPVVVISALIGGGCSLTTQRRNEDRVLRSQTISTPTQVKGYDAEVSFERPASITVQAHRHKMCELADEQVVDRTVVTTRSAKGADILTAFGAVTLAGGGIGVYQVAGGKNTGARDVAWTAVFLAVGGAIVGDYLWAKSRAGESRENLGEVHQNVNRRTAACETMAAPGAVVRIINEKDPAGAMVATTDGRGIGRVEFGDGNAGLLNGWEYGGKLLPAKLSVYVNDSLAGSTDVLGVVVRERLETTPAFRALSEVVDFLNKNAVDDPWLPQRHTYQDPCTLRLEGGIATASLTVNLKTLRLGILEEHTTTEGVVGNVHSISVRDGGRSTEVSFQRISVGQRLAQGLKRLGTLCGASLTGG